MYVKDGDHPRHHKGKPFFRNTARKKAIYARNVLTLKIKHKFGGNIASDIMGDATLKEKTSKGLFWGGASSFIQQLLNAAFGIYLARTLSPGDYGMVGVLTVFNLVVLTIQDGGFVSALVNRKEIKHQDYNGVFWFSFFVSLACYVILFFCAPLISGFFHQPELVSICRCSFVGLLAAGLGTAPRAFLTKKLMFKEMAIVNIVTVVISGTVGVFLARNGFAYWALVAQALLMNILTTVGLWLYSTWRPTLHIDFRPVREMLRYSIKLVITYVISNISNNIVTVILGRFYSPVKVGYYTQANKWSIMGTSVLNSMISTVSQPVLATVVDDKERQLRIFRKMVRFSAFIAFPAMLGLAFIAPEFIPVALGDKWAESIPLLQILCIGGSVTPLTYNFTGLLLSRGKSGAFMVSNIFFSIFLVTSAFLCYPLGVIAMVIAIALINIVWLFVWYLIVRVENAYTFGELLMDLLPFLGISVLSMFVAWLITKGIHNAPLLLVSKIVITALIYVALMKVSASVTYKECIQFIKSRFSKI